MAITFYEEVNGFEDYQKLWKNHGHKDYRFEDLHKAEAVILKAREMYRDLQQKFIDTGGDRGTCVLGNGIYIAVLPPRARIAFEMKLCSPLGQSDFPSSHCKDPVLKFLKDNGLDCWYECGRMD